MRAFILAAGHGTRLKPLTDRIPKCLVPIRGTPLLGIWLELCKRHGITDVLINIHSHAGQVREYLAAQQHPVRVHVSEEPELLGSAGTLKSNAGWAGSEPFWIFYGDVLTTVDLGAIQRFHREHRQVATLGIKEVPDPKRCGIVEIDPGNIIQSFVEKPARPASNLAFAGLILAEPNFLDFIQGECPLDIGFHVLPALGGRIAGYRITDYLIDVGTAENYQTAQTSWPGLEERNI